MDHELNKKQTSAKYALEFKQEDVRQVKTGRAASTMAAMLGMSRASLKNLVRADAKGQLAIAVEGKPDAVRTTLVGSAAQICHLRISDRVDGS